MLTNQPSQTQSELLSPDHHRRIERLLDELKQEARGDDARSLCDCWTRFERELDAHLLAEEEQILPAFAKQHPMEADAIRRDHRRSAGSSESWGSASTCTFCAPRSPIG